MKYIPLLVLLLSSTTCLIAMNQQELKKQETIKDVSTDQLTEKETECYQWFLEKRKQVPSYIQKLSNQDRYIFNYRLSYNEHPEAVEISRNNYVEAVYREAQELKVKLEEYDKETVKKVVLKVAKIPQKPNPEKPTDEPSARRYAFSTLLTQKEQYTYLENNYRKNPEIAKQVALKWSNLVVEELVELFIIEDTQESREARAKELYYEQLARFQNYHKTLN